MKRVRVPLALCMLCGGAVSVTQRAHAEDADVLAQRLGTISAHLIQGHATLEKLEEEYLDVLGLPLTPEQRGLVFTKMACMYASAGGAEYCDTTATYCQEALSYPVAADVAGDLYLYWAVALRQHYAGWRGVRYSVARHRIVEPVLAGLRLVLDAGAPARPTDLPRVDRYTVMGEHPDLEKRHAEQMAARQNAVLLDRLFKQRSGLAGMCTALYSQPPADPEELQRLLTQALPRYPDVVQQIMTELKKGK